MNTTYRKQRWHIATAILLGLIAGPLTFLPTQSYGKGPGGGDDPVSNCPVALEEGLNCARNNPDNYEACVVCCNLACDGCSETPSETDPMSPHDHCLTEAAQSCDED